MNERLYDSILKYSAQQQNSSSLYTSNNYWNKILEILFVVFMFPILIKFIVKFIIYLFFILLVLIFHVKMIHSTEKV